MVASGTSLDRQALVELSQLCKLGVSKGGRTEARDKCMPILRDWASSTALDTVET